MGPNAQWGIHADTLRAKILRIFEQFGREDLVFDDLLLVVQIIDKQVQCLDALLEPRLDLLPLFLVDYAGNNVERPCAIDRTFLFRVHGKGNTHHVNRGVGCRLVFFDVMVFQGA